MENKETQMNTVIKDMSLMINKPYIAYVFKKTQKIAQVLYIVTDYFDATEPLRNSIRRNANLLLESAGELLRNDQKDNQSVSKNLIGSFLETLGLIETAELIHLLSEKNHSILREEITHVIDQVESNKEKKIQLSKEFTTTPSLEEYKRQSVLYKGQSDVLDIKDIYIKPIQKDTPAPAHPKVARAPQMESKVQRSVQVIGLFKPGIELMIKDIATHMKEVSEKTIQRELLSLVARGILKKKGERRWSRYSLKQ